jgi:hypothetical protein
VSGGRDRPLTPTTNYQLLTGNGQRGTWNTEPGTDLLASLASVRRSEFRVPSSKVLVTGYRLLVTSASYQLHSRGAFEVRSIGTPAEPGGGYGASPGPTPSGSTASWWSRSEGGP